MVATWCCNNYLLFEGERIFVLCFVTHSQRKKSKCIKDEHTTYGNKMYRTGYGVKQAQSLRVRT